MRLIIVLLLCWIIGSSALAQSFLKKGWGIESSLHVGRAFKHRSTITIDFPDWSIGGELSLERQTYGTKTWHERCGFPRWGIALSYLYSGNAQEMGHGIAILPHLTIDFIKRPTWRIFGRLGVGLGIITRPFDRRTNPRNNMVGSYLNNNTAIRLGGAIRLHSQWELRPSFAFTHFSNAASTLPNLGVNTMTFQMGLFYTPIPVEATDYHRSSMEERPQRSKRVQFSAVFSAGVRELVVAGPKYPVWHISVDAGWFIALNNRLKGGIEYDYVGAYASFMRHNGGYEGQDVDWLASHLSIFIADEIFIGRFSVSAQIGIYLTQNYGQIWFLNTRLSARYYLLDPYVNHRPTPFLTVTMKSHRIIAEYFSVGAGMAF